MPSPGRRHDRTILDILDGLERQSFAGTVWRVTRKGRDALRGSAAQGRWSPGDEFEVLYTSLERDGAIAEIGYRLSLEPVWPSQVEHAIHQIAVKTERTLRIADLDELARFGVDVSRYQTFDYAATQAIAMAAHFLEFDGLLVPSARAACANLVVFLERMAADALLEVRDTQPVDWATWRKSTGHS